MMRTVRQYSLQIVIAACVIGPMAGCGVEHAGSAPTTYVRPGHTLPASTTSVSSPTAVSSSVPEPTTVPTITDTCSGSYWYGDAVNTHVWIGRRVAQDARIVVTTTDGKVSSWTNTVTSDDGYARKGWYSESTTPLLGTPVATVARVDLQIDGRTCPIRKTG